MTTNIYTSKEEIKKKFSETNENISLLCQQLKLSESESDQQEISEKIKKLERLAKQLTNDLIRIKYRKRK